MPPRPCNNTSFHHTYIRGLGPVMVRGVGLIYMMFLGGSALGCHLGVSGGLSSMASFIEEFFPEIHRRKEEEDEANQYCKFNSHKLQFFTSSLYLAAFITSLGASCITKKFGYRKIMIMIGFNFLLGTVLFAVASNIVMLFAGRILTGIAVGFTNQTMRRYISEMSPFLYRECFNSIFELTIISGILQANVASCEVIDSGKNRGWRYSVYQSAGVYTFAFLIILPLYLSETPNSLVERGKNEEAKSLFTRINYAAKADILETKFNEMVAAAEEARLVQNPWNNLVNKKCYRPQLAMCILIPLFHQFTGLSVIIFYGTVIFKSMGSLEQDAYHISAIITIIVYLVTFGVSIYDGDRQWGIKYHRLPFLTFHLFESLFVLMQPMAAMVMGGLGVLILSKTNIPPWFPKAVVTCICMYMVAFPRSWGPLGWFYPNEVFPVEVRSAAQSVMVAVNMLAAFIMAQFFLTMFCFMEYGVFFFFAFFVLLVTVYGYFFMPEMKNISDKEMIQGWREHWFWKRFMNDLDDPVNDQASTECLSLLETNHV